MSAFRQGNSRPNNLNGLFDSEDSQFVASSQLSTRLDLVDSTRSFAFAFTAGDLSQAEDSLSSEFHAVASASALTGPDPSRGNDGLSEESTERNRIYASTSRSVFNSSAATTVPPIIAFQQNQNNFPPTVTVHDTNIQLGQKVNLLDLFTVSDLDPNSFVSFLRVRDSSTNPQTGLWFKDGIPQQQGLVFEIPYALAHTVEYRSGVVISSEQISIEANDGKFTSEPGVGTMFSVQPNLNPPVVTTTDFSVVATELINVDSFIEAVDPDGYPILDFMVVARSGDIHGGKLVFKGVDVPDGVWFKIAAEDMQFLQYRGGEYGTAETLTVIARDEGAWSAQVDLLATTAPNLNDPVVVAKDTSVLRGKEIAAEELFSFADADFNTLKWVQFMDLGFAAISGYFTVGGVKQAAGSVFRVNASQLSTVKYVGGSEFTVEAFQVQAFDGQRLSNVSRADLSTIDVPGVEVPATLTMLDTFETRPLHSMITVNSNVTPTSYQVMDRNAGATTAAIYVGSTRLEGGVIHTLTPAEFQLATVQGGADDFGRSLDEFMVRVDNDFAKSAWASLNVSTDPVNESSVLDIGRWEFVTPVLELTYNFPSTVPSYYCSQGLDECDAFQAMTDPDQRAAVRDTMTLFQDFFNIRFTEVAPNLPADITYALTTAGPDGAAAYARAPGVVGQPSPAGDIWGVADANGIFDSNPGEFGYSVWQHELGHALGLDHSFAGSGILPPAMESDKFSMMSYTGAFFDDGAPVYTVTPMLYDVMALQTHYGANPTFRAGNTHIKFDKNGTLPQVVYDSGGFDTFNLNNHSINSTINLNEGQHSTVTGLQDNVAIAWGTLIENARGGSGNDTIIGNETNNLLFGNAGNDVIRGGGGPDFLFGMRGNDTFEYFVGDGHDTINDRLGAGRDSVHIHLFDENIDDPEDPLGGDTLLDNFEFRVNGLDLEISLTLDSVADDGGLTIEQMGFGRNRIETLRLFNAEGTQIGPDISLLSVFQFGSSTSQAFRITENTSRYGNLVTPA